MQMSKDNLLSILNRL